VVFTSLALFNVLIAPLNAFPWVVNGVVEALVSLRRIQTYLLLPQRCPNWAYAPHLLPGVLAAQQQQQQPQQLAVVPGSSSSSGGSKRSRDRCLWFRKWGGVSGKHQAVVQQPRAPQGQQQQQQQLGALSIWVSAGSSGISGSNGSIGKKAVTPHELDSSAAAQFCDASFAWRKVRAFLPCGVLLWRSSHEILS
jgi:hypothetical protein